MDWVRCERTLQSLMQRELPRGRLTEIAQARFTTHHNLERR
jgi:hypothetical protein